MTHLPLIFQSPEKPEIVPNFSTLVTNPYLKEYVDTLSFYLDVKFPTNQSNFMDSLLAKNNPTHQAVIYGGIAQSLIGKGQFIDAAKTMGYAHSQIPKSNKKLQILLLVEMARLLIRINNLNDAIFLIQIAKDQAGKSNLQHVVQFYELVIKQKLGQEVLLDDLQLSASHFSLKNQRSILAHHHRLEGLIHKSNGEFAKAKKRFNMGKDIAQKENYTHIAESIQIQSALIEMDMGNTEKCIESLKSFSPIEKNYYHRVLGHSKLGAIIRKSGDGNEATYYLQQGLNLATQYGVDHLIPFCTYHLGECYEEQKKLKLAHYFFERGYQTAINLTRRKLGCTDQFLKSIERYIKFLRDNPLSQQTQPVESDFSFAKDKSLIDIRSIFQNALLGIFYAKYGTFKDMAKKLNISERTISLVKHRIKYQNFQEVPDSVAQFIHRHPDKDWKEINQFFEAKVLNYLYKIHYHNKKKMSEKLNISYPHMLNLLKNAESMKESSNE